MDSAYAGNPYRGSLYLNWARLYVDAKEQEDILEELQLVIARQVQLEQMCSAEVSQAPSRERKNPALGHQLGVKALVRQLTTDLTRPVQNERFRSGRRARPTGGRTQYPIPGFWAAVPSRWWTPCRIWPGSPVRWTAAETCGPCATVCCPAGPSQTQIRPERLAIGKWLAWD